MKHLRTSLVFLLALALALGACSDDGGDDSSASGSGSASVESDGEGGDEGDDDESGDGEGEGDDTQTEPLEPEEARAAGNPAVYERVETSEDCATLARELRAHESNAETRREAGDERRASILDEYAAATSERMDELKCPADAGSTSSTTTTAAA